MSTQEIDAYVEGLSEEELHRLLHAVRRRLLRHPAEQSAFDPEFSRLLDRHIEEHRETWRALAES